MIRNIILLVFCILSFNFSLAQTEQEIDSLIAVYNESPQDLDQYDRLLSLCSYFIDRDLEKSIFYSDKMIELGVLLDQDSIQGRGYKRKGMALGYLQKYDEANKALIKSYSLDSLNKDYLGMASTLRDLGQNAMLVGGLEAAEDYFTKGIELYREVGDSTGTAHMYNAIAVLYLNQGKFDYALEYGLKTEKNYALDTTNNLYLNMNRLLLGFIYSEMKDTLNTIAISEKSLAYFRKEKLTRQQAMSLGVLSSFQIRNPAYHNEAKKNVNELLDLAQQLNDSSMYSSARLSKSELLLNMGDYKQAREIALADLDDYKTILNSEDIMKRQKVIAASYWVVGDSNKALNYYTAANKMAHQLGDIDEQGTIYGALAVIYEDKGDTKAALENYKLFKERKDSIYTKDFQDRYSELQTKYETEKKEAAIQLQEVEIRALNEEVKVSNLTKSLYGIGMFAFVAIAGLLYFGFQQRIKKNKIAREKQEAIYKQEIEFKKKELASQTLHLVQKSSFIEELKTNLERIKESPDLFKIEFRRLIMLLKKEKAEDKDWEVFKSYFSEVHNDFDMKLKSIYADITEKEIRLASFLRMNLSTKEIATMLNVLPDSVLKSKYRLKKKFNLSKEDDLLAFLSSL